MMVGGASSDAIRTYDISTAVEEEAASGGGRGSCGDWLNLLEFPIPIWPEDPALRSEASAGFRA